MLYDILKWKYFMPRIEAKFIFSPHIWIVKLCFLGHFLYRCDVALIQYFLYIFSLPKCCMKGVEISLKNKTKSRDKETTGHVFPLPNFGILDAKAPLFEAKIIKAHGVHSLRVMIFGWKCLYRYFHELFVALYQYHSLKIVYQKCSQISLC